jgi:hypothetical protein
MAISFLQQQGLGSSVDFNLQVNAVVTQEAMARADNGGHPEELDSNQQNTLATIARSPTTYGFTTIILADGGWGLTYDAWADDPKAADYPILVSVQKWFNFLTGYVPTPPAPAEPAP